MAKAIYLLVALVFVAIGLAVGLAFWAGLAWLCWGSLATAPLWFQVLAGLSLAGAFGRSARSTLRTVHYSRSL